MSNYTDEARLNWLESMLTLHTGVDVLYVVDGYEVTITKDANPGNKYWGATLREAIDNALARERPPRGYHFPAKSYERYEGNPG